MNETAAGIAEKKVRVLLVDDNALVLDALSDLLNEDPRVRVVGAEAGVDDAIACAVLSRPDAILLDVHMPGAGSHHVVREIRKWLPDVRIVALSAAMGEHDVARMMSLGADMCISKTTDFTTLIRSLTR